MGFLDFLFPKYCVNCRKIGDYLCSDCFSFLSFDAMPMCIACNHPSMDGLTHPVCRERYVIDGAFSSISYRGVVKKLIYKFKYKPYLADLRNFLTELFFEGLIQKEEFSKACQANPILVPIPLYSSKERRRGYNQAEILAKGLAKKLTLKTFNLLKKTKETPTQVGLTREKRIKNLKGAFLAASNISISQYSNILLVDDVLTTGATLLEAANVLKRNGAKRVWGITLARG